MSNSRRDHKKVVNTWMSENSIASLERHDKSQVWNKIKRNCSFLLLEYTINDISSCLGVCKGWNQDIKQLLFSKCSQLATQLSNTNHPYLKLHRSFINISRPIKKFGWYRINFTFECQPKETLRGKNIVLSHRYELTCRPEKSLFSNYCFDCLDSEEHRSMWILHEDTKHSHIPQLTSPMPILQLSRNDQFRISVSFWSGDGLMKFDTISWQPLVVTPRQVIYSYPNRMIDSSFDQLRSSEVELTAKWRSDAKDPIRKLIPKDYLAPCFERLAIATSGLDPLVVKAVFKAVEEGRTDLTRHCQAERDQRWQV